MIHHLAGWLYVHLGFATTGLPAPWNAFWSGFGSDITEFALFTGVFAAMYHGYRKNNCHQHKCLRIGRHVVDGTPWCDHHHQDARDKAKGVSGEAAASGLLGGYGRHGRAGQGSMRSGTVRFGRLGRAWQVRCGRVGLALDWPGRLGMAW